MKRTVPHKSGFTLIEILLALTILGILTVFAMNMNNSFRTMTKARETRSRMEHIAKKAKDYYRGHRNLPLPKGPVSAALPTTDTDPPTSSATPLAFGDKVPVDASDLNMEQKYRLDGWGKYLQYVTFRNDNRHGRPAVIIIDRLSSPSTGENIHIPLFEKTLIRGIDLNNGGTGGIGIYNNRYAGIIISAGPNQVFEYRSDTNTVGLNDSHMVYVKQYTLDQGSDDIVVVIDLSEEAVQMAIDGVNYLNAKVDRFEKVFSGVDNDSDGVVDEDSCNGFGTGASPSFAINYNSVCLIKTKGSGSGYNDPNCGTATLDRVMANLYVLPSPACTSVCNWWDVDTQWDHTVSPFLDETDNDAARAFLYCFYSLPDHTVYDPWLNGYVWGCDMGTCSSSLLAIDSANPRYQKFFSAGPDGQLGVMTSTEAADDITP